MDMKIQVARTAGFCMGVRRAVEMVLDASLQESARPIYTFGPLIHNPQVLNLLVRKGIHILDDIPSQGTGTVLIRAHGVSPEIKRNLRECGFDVLDATCPRVVKIQQIIRTYTSRKYTSIIIGDQTHPEVMGLLGYSGGNGHVMGSIEELEELPIFTNAVVVAQSTQNIAFYEKVKEWIRDNVPHYQIFDTICDSTERRQNEVRELAENVDSIVVVGGRNSGNTKRLVEIAEATGKRTYHIENENELESLNPGDFSADRVVGITGGASTPNWVINRAYWALEKMQSGLKDIPGQQEKKIISRMDHPLAPFQVDHLEQEILGKVSRSFALTIPQLPDGLRQRVTNAYLVCRIIDTIEDEESLCLAEKRIFFQEFSDAVKGIRSIDEFIDKLHPMLCSNTLPEEKELIAHSGHVLNMLFNFTPRQQAIIKRCVDVMADGMLRFQENRSSAGLKDLAHMNGYCYHVAGVVGEMLTELFCDYSSEIALNYERMMSLSPSFGQGLQMTNILKDMWEDLERGACWLPRDIFRKHGYDLARLKTPGDRSGFEDGLSEMIGIAHYHLRNAMEYTLLIPRGEKGIRRFCLWAIGMAALTLQNIHRFPRYTTGGDVKISRRTLKAVIILTNLSTGSNRMLRGLFRMATRGLPLNIEDSLGVKPAVQNVHELPGSLRVR